MEKGRRGRSCEKMPLDGRRSRWRKEEGEDAFSSRWVGGNRDGERKTWPRLHTLCNPHTYIFFQVPLRSSKSCNNAKIVLQFQLVPVRLINPKDAISILFQFYIIKPRSPQSPIPNFERASERAPDEQQQESQQ